MAVKIEQLTFVAHAPEPSSDTMTPGTPFEITVSGSSATTVASTANFTSADADDYVGNWLEATSGNIEGEWVRIREFDTATDTVTTDPWSATPTTFTTCRMWVPPEPLLVQTAAASAATTIEAGDRSETDTTYWADPDRYYAVCEASKGSAIVRGEAKLISAFDGSSTFTTAAFSASPENGDLFVIRQPLKLMGAEMEEPTAEHAVIERPFIRGDFLKEPHVLGPRSGSLSLTLEAKGVSTAASGATAAIPAVEARDFLASILIENADGATTISGTSSSTTAINVADGEGARLEIGNLGLVNGEVFGITDLVTSGDPDVLTASPAVTTAPTVAGVAVTGGVNYRPRSAVANAWAATSGGVRSHTIERYIGGGATSASREIVYGWHFDLELGGLTADAIPQWKLSGPFDFHIKNEVAAPYTPTFESAMPRASRASRVVYGGTALTGVTEATFKLGLTYEPVPSVAHRATGRNGHMCTGRMSTGTMRVWMEDLVLYEDFQRARERELLIQVGSTPGKIIAVWIPVIQWTKCNLTKEAGGYRYELEYAVRRSNITSVDDFCIGQF